jgi:hypothetical protein
MAARQGIDEEGGEVASPGFVRPRHKEDGRQYEQDGCVALSLYMTNHVLIFTAQAIILAAAIAHKFYLLLIRPPTIGAVVPSHGESGTLHRVGYKEQISD